MPGAQVGERGQFAPSPFLVPPQGWRDTLARVRVNIGADRVSVLSAGIAFYAFLALFPALAAFVIVYGLIADPSTVEAQLAPLREIVPQEVYRIIIQQMTRIASTTEQTLSLQLLFSLALALWSATKGINAVLAALDVAYKERRGRPFLLRNLVAILFTVGGIVFALIALSLIAVVPAVIEFLGIGGRYTTLLMWLRWVFMAVLIVIALAILYHFGPSRRAARFIWVTPGALAAGVLWLASSMAFSFYVANFGSYNQTFGSLGAVVVLLFWLYLSAYVVCLGAELNAELEHQTYHDSTIGPARPQGMRGAYVADHTAHPG